MWRAAAGDPPAVITNQAAAEPQQHAGLAMRCSPLASDHPHQLHHRPPRAQSGRCGACMPFAIAPQPPGVDGGCAACLNLVTAQAATHRAGLPCRNQHKTTPSCRHRCTYAATRELVRRRRRTCLMHVCAGWVGASGVHANDECAVGLLLFSRRSLWCCARARTRAHKHTHTPLSS